MRRPDLLGLPGRRRRDHLYRPLLPPDLEALQALQAPETNRQPPKLRVITKTVSGTVSSHGRRQDFDEKDKMVKNQNPFDE